jgi:putative FmdB family regulatory protein
MPTYEYKCGKCGATFNVNKSMWSSNRPETCPSCGTHGAEKIISRVNINSEDSCSPRGGRFT